MVLGPAVYQNSVVGKFQRRMAFPIVIQREGENFKLKADEEPLRPDNPLRGAVIDRYRTGFYLQRLHRSEVGGGLSSRQPLLWRLPAPL